MLLIVSFNAMFGINILSWSGLPVCGLRSDFSKSQLLNSLQHLSEVDIAQLDMQWLKRLTNIFNVVGHFVVALAFLLGFGVLLIIGNTIRLASQNGRREIVVLKMVGATNAFIRRPFLYTGLWYGFFGGIIAWILVAVIVAWLALPVSRLASSYNSSFYFQNISFHTGIHLLVISMFLGFIGSWVAVSRDL